MAGAALAIRRAKHRSILKTTGETESGRSIKVISRLSALEAELPDSPGRSHTENKVERNRNSGHKQGQANRS